MGFITNSDIKSTNLKKQLLFVIAVAFDLHSFANSQDEVLLLSNDIHTEKALEYMRYSFQVVML